MIEALAQPAQPIHLSVRTAPAISTTISAAILRYGLALFLVSWGLYKFTDTEANAIQPLLAHSPFLGWWLAALAGTEGAADIIGVIEIALGMLLAGRRWWPRVSAIGSLANARQLLGAPTGARRR